MESHSLALARAFTVASAAATAACLGTVLGVSEACALWARRDGMAFDDLVLVAAVAVLLAGSVWLGVAVALTALAESGRRGRRVAGALARACTPTVVRVLVQAVCGVAAIAAPPLLTSPATAAELGRPACPTTSCTAALDGSTRLPPPDRPASSRAPSAERVRVRAGDTLWAIARRHLSRDASNAEIAAAWPAWFEANRNRIGPDPDLIYPGTVLIVPTQFHSASD